MMIAIFENRRNARRIARKLRCSLAYAPCHWDVTDAPVSQMFGGEESEGAAVELSGTEFVIELHPRRFRLFDRVTLKHRGHDIWLPLIARIRLRNAVRRWFLINARKALQA